MGSNIITNSGDLNSPPQNQTKPIFKNFNICDHQFRWACFVVVVVFIVAINFSKKLEEMAALMMSRYITPVTDLLSNNMLSFVSYLAEWFFAVLFPGPDFGKAAVALHSVGPVLSFMAGCTSNDAFFLAFVPGVIAGVGLSIAFEQRQEQRSLARRRKVK